MSLDMILIPILRAVDRKTLTGRVSADRPLSSRGSHAIKRRVDYSVNRGGPAHSYVHRCRGSANRFSKYSKRWVPSVSLADIRDIVMYSDTWCPQYPEVCSSTHFLVAGKGRVLARPRMQDCRRHSQI